MFFCVKTYKSNCYIAQLFLDQSTIVQLDVVVWSENSDIQTETASRRDSLSLLHKFARCAKRRQSLFPCPLAALRGVGSQIVVSPAQSWMANSTESFRRKGTASIAYIPARKAISYGKMVILWTFASSSDKGAFPSAPLKREYGEAVD